MGMQFGLWIEPEMVNPDTKLWAEHPDWVLHQPGRHQYVLDYSNPAVVEHLFRHFEQLFDGVPLRYVKWDMNRSISDAFSCTAGPSSRMGGGPAAAL